MGSKPQVGWTFQLSIAALAAFIAGPALATSRAIPAIAGFALFVLGGLLALGIGVFGTVARLRGKANGGVASLVMGGVGIVLIALALRASHYPPINDITTDLGDPPSFAQAQSLPANRDRDLSYPEHFKEIVRTAYPDLKSFRVTDPPRKVFDRALFLARATPSWKITRVDRGTLTFEGVDTTRIFKFQDDFVVRVRPDGDGAVVDMRSKSRDGKGDLGANAERIREFWEMLRHE